MKYCTTYVSVVAKMIDILLIAGPKLPRIPSNTGTMALLQLKI